MFDAVCRSDGVALQRATGSLRIAFKRRDAGTALDALYQRGCLKARLPRPEPGDWPVAVTLNSSGGVAGGDHLDTAIDLAAGTRATITAQAAERFYRALPGGGPAVVRTRVTVGAGAMVEWLPQETILFDRCALDRRLELDLAADARFLGIEMLVFGRTAMGETVQTGSLHDLIQLRREGRLVWQDAIRLDGAIDATLRRPAIANGARAVATVLYAGPDAGDHLETLRAALPTLPATESACSAWNGLLLTRVLAAEGAALRRAVVAILEVLRDGRGMPRVWTC
jgi:urease accessory protein